jgi:hypothetical protein
MMPAMRQFDLRQSIPRHAKDDVPGGAPSGGTGLGKETGDSRLRRRRHGLAKARPDLFY